jgi:hypothetical protein
MGQFQLNFFSECSNLTYYLQGKLDPVVGRQPQIERVTQILGRRTKNNPCLIGEPGVGKTAIAEGLAQRIATGDVPETLEGKKVLFSLSFYYLIEFGIALKIPSYDVGRLENHNAYCSGKILGGKVLALLIGCS